MMRLDARPWTGSGMRQDPNDGGPRGVSSVSSEQPDCARARIEAGRWRARCDALADGWWRHSRPGTSPLMAADGGDRAFYELYEVLIAEHRLSGMCAGCKACAS